MSTLLTFFASTYSAVFNFQDGPPVHDALCIAYLARPEIFQGKRYRVDVELQGEHTTGTTVVDLWEYKKDELTEFKKDPESRASWGRLGKNVFVLEELDVRRLCLRPFAPSGVEPGANAAAIIQGARVLEALPAGGRLGGQGLAAQQEGVVERFSMRLHRSRHNDGRLSTGQRRGRAWCVGR